MKHKQYITGPLDCLKCEGPTFIADTRKNVEGAVFQLLRCRICGEEFFIRITVHKFTGKKIK